MKFYEIRDPVYGFIEFNEWEKEIIDHPMFQRLRRIRQLGFTDMVYPGAMHTRFEHSLGVMHLITKMYNSIIQRNEKFLEENVNYNKTDLERERQLIRLAGLLHDVGHPPFSHSSEELFPDGYSHEDYTIAIIKTSFKKIIDGHRINKNYNITSEEVAGMISGNAEILKEKIFWKILLSSQLDADRCDYLLRDSLHIGVKYGVFDLERLLISLKLGRDPETKDPILGIDEASWHVAESVVIARYLIFTQVYYHKTRRAYDLMLTEALKEAIGRYPPPTTSDGSISTFCGYNDYTITPILLEKSKWFAEMLKRNHIRVSEETEELPTKEGIEKLEELMKKLKENKIWYAVDDFSKKTKEWYNMEDEILIIGDKGNVQPLSYYSKIVKNLPKKFAKSRIYVKREDRERAKKITKE